MKILENFKRRYMQDQARILNVLERHGHKIEWGERPEMTILVTSATAKVSLLIDGKVVAEFENQYSHMLDAERKRAAEPVSVRMLTENGEKFVEVPRSLTEAPSVVDDGFPLVRGFYECKDFAVASSFVTISACPEKGERLAIVYRQISAENVKNIRADYGDEAEY